jgi:hypothetical protein
MGQRRNLGDLVPPPADQRHQDAAAAAAAVADGKPARPPRRARAAGPTANGTKPAAAKRAKTPPAAPPAEAAELDADQLGRWRWLLRAEAGRAARAQTRARAALTAWDRLTGEASAAGVPERLAVAAAADAGLDTPAAG